VGKNIMMGNRSRKILSYAFFITFSFFFVELIGGYISKSYALMSDALHMLVDVFAIGMSYFAERIAVKKRNLQKTFGYHRFEIIAALFNGLILAGMSLFIISRAYKRILKPEGVLTEIMIPVAIFGLMANIVVGVILYKGKKENLNVKSAFLHVIGDTLSSVTVLGGAIWMGLTEFYFMDPIISIFIALLILFQAGVLIKECVEILTESAPKGINAEEIISSLRSIPGVKKIHDFHIWSLSTGFVNVTSHILVENDANPKDVLISAGKILKEKFNINHFTFQIENEMNEACFQCEEMESESH
jgi:cobalt-zinc-cadmium efflux system protein